MEMGTDETPRRNPNKRKSSIHTTPLLQFYTQKRQPAQPSREPADDLRRQLSLTPVTRRQSLATTSSSISRNVSNNTPGQSSRQPLSKMELDNLLKNCLELANKNRITEGNVWDLRLIDHLKDFQQPEDGEANVNFDRASAGLGAAVQIYSKRVESALTQAFEVMTKMSDNTKKNKKGSDANTPGDNEDDLLEGQTQIQNTAQRRKKKRPATLAPLEAITKKAGDTEERDYLFEQSCAEFNEGGFNGMMMSKGGLCRGLEWVIDLNDTRDGPLALDPAHGEVDGSILPNLGQAQNFYLATDLFEEARILLGHWGNDHMEESFKSVVNDAVDHLQKKGMSQVFIEKSIAMQEDQDQGDVAMSPMGSAGFNGPEPFEDLNADSNGLGLHDSIDLMPVDPVENNDNIHDGSLLEVDNQDLFTLHSDDADDAAGIGSFHADLPQPDIEMSMFQEDTEEYGPCGDELKQILEQLSTVPVGARAPQMPHWRFNRPSTTTAKQQQRRKRKKAEDYDFRNLPAVNLETALASESNTSSINRKAQNRTQTQLAPRVAHYKPDFLVNLNLHFGVGCVAREWQSSTHLAEDEAGTGGNFFDDDGFEEPLDLNTGGEFEEHPGLGALGADGLVLEPPKVQEIDLNLPKYAIQVDMDALKGAMWTVVKDIHLKTNGGLVSFQDVIHDLPAEGSWGRRKDLSIHICFAALLHIVNEHELEISNTTDLCQVHLRVPQ